MLRIFPHVVEMIGANLRTSDFDNTWLNYGKWLASGGGSDPGTPAYCILNIYISNKLKRSQVNCTMCTTPVQTVPKHIFMADRASLAVIKELRKFLASMVRSNGRNIRFTV